MFLSWHAADPDLVVRVAVQEDGSVGAFTTSTQEVSDNDQKCVAAAQGVRYDAPPTGVSIRGHAQLRTIKVKSTKQAASSGLSSKDVNDVLVAAGEDFKQCYEREMQSQPAMAGYVNLLLTIDANGEVSRAYTATRMRNRFMEWCIVDRAMRLEFPPPPSGGSAADINYPMRFMPAGACTAPKR